MIKRVFKGALCAALSLSMALGGVLVGASQQKSTKAQIGVENLQASMGNMMVSPKKKMNNISPRSSQPTSAVIVNTWSGYDSFMNNQQDQSKVKGTVISAGYIPVGVLKVSKAGTVIVNYHCSITYKNGSNSESYLELVHTNGAAISGVTQNNTTGIGKNRKLWATNVPAGTYYLITSASYSEGTAIDAGFLSAVVPNANGRYLTSGGIAVGGNGGTSYQYFKMSKRGVAKLALLRQVYYGGPYGTEYTIQKKSGKKWKTVQGKKSSSGNTYSCVGLNAGTYRLALKSPASTVLKLSIKSSKANSTYGTKKSKAKSIQRKKYKRQTFLPTDKSGKAHWYKIKVSKTRTTYIDITDMGSSGSIWAQVSGKIRMKSKNISNGIRFYGKAKKGTYYIKVYKTTKSTTGSYQVKYKQ